jgi:hypothetical protein
MNVLLEQRGLGLYSQLLISCNFYGNQLYIELID